MESFEVQTRSDSSLGKHSGLEFWGSVKEAHDAYLADKNIWKISWTVATDGEISQRQFIEKIAHPKDGFSKEEEEILCSLSPQYKEEFSKQSMKMFWLEKTLIPDNTDEVFQMPKEKQEKEWFIRTVKGLYTDEEFVQSFC